MQSPRFLCKLGIINNFCFYGATTFSSSTFAEVKIQNKNKFIFNSHTCSWHSTWVPRTHTGERIVDLGKSRYPHAEKWNKTLFSSLYTNNRKQNKEFTINYETTRRKQARQGLFGYNAKSKIRQLVLCQSLLSTPSIQQKKQYKNNLLNGEKQTIIPEKELQYPDYINNSNKSVAKPPPSNLRPSKRIFLGDI